MVRPSLLQRAELCGLVPALAEKYPEAGQAADRGTQIHAEIARCLGSGEAPTTPEARAAVEWLRGYVGDSDASIAVEGKVSLIDTDTMDTITEGTPDAVVTFGDGSLTVIDWKTGRPENVEDIDTNLQLIAYGLATCGGEAFHTALVFLDGDAVDVRFSSEFAPSQHQELLARVKLAATREPVASPGDHCGKCYQRHYCDAWKARLSTALVACGEPAPSALVPETAAKLATMLDAAETWVDAAKAALKAYIRDGGVVEKGGKVAAITSVAGKKTADVKALEADGLARYVKQGASFERITWRKAV